MSEYIEALLHERSIYVTRGLDARVADVDAELARVSDPDADVDADAEHEVDVESAAAEKATPAPLEHAVPVAPATATR